MGLRLTKTVVDHLTPPEKGQAFYRDDLLSGFGVRITAGGTKSFIVETQVNGRNRRVTLGRFGPLTVEQARREAQKYLGKVATGIDPKAEAREASARTITLAQVVEEYLIVRKGLSPQTVHDYRRIMRECFPDWQNRPLNQITKDAVAARHRKFGERSPARANNAMRVLRALFNFAQGQYEDAEGRTLFPENPIKRLSHTRAWYPNKRRQTVVRRAQLPAWFEGVMSLKANPEDREAIAGADYLLLLMLTGLRRSEGLTLKWEDVDLVEKTLLIRHTKNHEPLHLPLSDFLFDLLSERAKHRINDYVFPGSGKAGHLVEPKKQMRKVINRSRVTFTPHDLRRTFITVAESLDISVYAIKRLVNHKMGNDVTAGYIIPDAERLRAPMQQITDFFLSVGGLRKASQVVPIRSIEFAQAIRQGITA